MVSNWWTNIFCSFLLLFINIYSAQKPNLCKVNDGTLGNCVPPKRCPQSTLKEPCAGKAHGRGEFVCCPALSRIVTPNFPTTFPPPPVITLPPITIPPPPSTTSLSPIIEVPTTKMSNTITSLASTKCEEYKHRVIKRQSIITYVFGGTESLAKEFPHMAALGYGPPSNPEWLCGGSLISEQFVITAAHCVVLTTVGELNVVRLGDLNLRSSRDDATPEDFNVVERTIHPDYKLPAQYNDIALLKLDRLVNFNAYISPICLQTSNNVPNTDFIATGWGRTEFRGLQSDTLMKVDLDYFPNQICQQNYATVAPESLPRGIVDESQICAGSYTQERDTCQGDSGGPLQIRVDALYLVGITSFGKACGVPNSPAVYTRVSHYIPWIEQIVWGPGKK